MTPRHQQNGFEAIFRYRHQLFTFTGHSSLSFPCDFLALKSRLLYGCLLIWMTSTVIISSLPKAVDILLGVAPQGIHVPHLYQLLIVETKHLYGGTDEKQ